MTFLSRLYTKTLELARHRHASWGLGSISFMESSFFPIPPDVILMPMCLAKPEKSWRYATICTFASVAGGVLGYLIGALLMDSLGVWLIEALNAQEMFEKTQELFDVYGWWLILGAGLTPFPYKIATITAGMLGLSLPMFILCSIVGRGIRFYLIAGLLWKYGHAMDGLIRRYFGPLSIIGILLLLVGLLIWRG